MKATWNNTIIAQSDDTIVVENNHYFPKDSLVDAYFQASTHHTTCPWKGSADYLHVVVDGQTNENAAWTYPSPKPAAKEIAGYVAFWRGVKVTD